MKKRLMRVGTAALMAIGIALPATATPARADVGTVVAVVKQIYSLYQQFAGSGSTTLDQAIAQITAAIQTSQTAIISQIDLVATASVQACASSAVINFADINALSPANLQAFALDTTSCVTQANSLINVVTDKAAIDELGFAMNTVGPLALMARIKAGLTTPSLKAVLTAGDNTIITALLPACQYVNANGAGEPPFFEWECYAYNGAFGGAKARASAENFATARTSRAVALAALPLLV
jgi:hypothetical protein